MTNLEKLLASASSSICECLPITSGGCLDWVGALSDELIKILNRRNGFYAFEAALHVFPMRSNPQEMGLLEWNEEALWRVFYKDMAEGCLFFAEDVFGGQFCIKNNKIYIFDPETGGLEFLADDFEGWAREIVRDYDSLTGYPLAHQWQQRNGPLPSGKRLLPKIPFVAGGGFAVENLYLEDTVVGMRYRADIANQIRDLPDGSRIEFNVVD